MTKDIIEEELLGLIDEEEERGGWGFIRDITPEKIKDAKQQIRKIVQAHFQQTSKQSQGAKILSDGQVICGKCGATLGFIKDF